MITEFKPKARRFLTWIVPPVAIIVALFTFTAAAENKPAAEAPKPPESVRKEGPKAVSNITKRQIEALRAEVERLTEEIRRRQDMLDKLGEELGIVQPNEDGAPDLTAIAKMQNDLFRAEQEAAQFRNLHSGLNGMSPNHLRQALPTAYRDEGLDRLLTELAKAEQQLSKVQQQYSEKHPEVLQQEAAVKELNRQIDARVAGVMAGLKTLAESRQEAAASVAKQLQEHRRNEARMRRESRPYYSLKRDIETMQKARDTVYLRLLQEEVESRIPKSLL